MLNRFIGDSYQSCSWLVLTYHKASFSEHARCLSISPLIPFKICDFTAAYPLVIDVSMFLLGEFPLCAEMTHHRFSLPRKNNYYRLKEINNKNVRGLLIYLCISLSHPSPLPPPPLLVILHASCAITWFRARPISFPLSSFCCLDVPLWCSPPALAEVLFLTGIVDQPHGSLFSFSFFAHLFLFPPFFSILFVRFGLIRCPSETFTLLWIPMAVCQLNTE